MRVKMGCVPSHPVAPVPHQNSPCFCSCPYLGDVTPRGWQQNDAIAPAFGGMQRLELRPSFGEGKAAFVAHRTMFPAFGYGLVLEFVGPADMWKVASRALAETFFPTRVAPVRIPFTTEVECTNFARNRLVATWTLCEGTKTPTTIISPTRMAEGLLERGPIRLSETWEFLIQDAIGAHLQRGALWSMSWSPLPSPSVSTTNGVRIAVEFTALEELTRHLEIAWWEHAWRSHTVWWYGRSRVFDEGFQHARYEAGAWWPLFLALPNWSWQISAGHRHLAEFFAHLRDSRDMDQRNGVKFFSMGQLDNETVQLQVGAVAASSPDANLEVGAAIHQCTTPPVLITGPGRPDPEADAREFVRWIRLKRFTRIVVVDITQCLVSTAPDLPPAVPYPALCPFNRVPMAGSPKPKPDPDLATRIQCLRNAVQEGTVMRLHRATCDNLAGVFELRRCRLDTEEPWKLDAVRFGETLESLCQALCPAIAGIVIQTHQRTVRQRVKDFDTAIEATDSTAEQFLHIEAAIAHEISRSSLNLGGLAKLEIAAGNLYRTLQDSMPTGPCTVFVFSPRAVRFANVLFSAFN